MNDESIDDVRAAAAAAGIPWPWVVARKCELVECERQAREAPTGARRYAWELVCHWYGWAKSREEWWAVGFARCFPRITRTGECDHTSIRRYDEIAASVLTEFPGFAGDDADELWAWLLHTPYEPWPPRVTFYWRALDEIIETQARESAEATEVPF